MTSPKRLFLAYSSCPEDAVHAKELSKQLEPLRQAGLIEEWNESQVLPGQQVKAEIARQLAISEIILLLITPDFVADEDAQAVMAQAMERRAVGVLVIPVLVRSVLYTSLPILSDLSPLPRNGEPITTWADRDRAWVAVARGIRQTIFYMDGATPDHEASSPRNAPAHWILVAGSGDTDSLTPKIEQTCQDLGHALADCGYGLISGGWPGVDRAVAESFAEGLQEQSKKLERWLIQVLGRDQVPVFPGGNLILVDREEWAEEALDGLRRAYVARSPSIRLFQGRREWTEGVQRASAVVLIEGKGGTLATSQYAQQANKPVLPLAFTGGDAKQVYLQMLREWDRHPIPGLSREDFAELGRPLPGVVHAVCQLLPRILGLPSPSPVREDAGRGAVGGRARDG